MLLLSVSLGAAAAESDFSGSLGLEYRYFPSAPLDPRQHGNNLSLTVEPEYALTWDNDRQSLVVRLFGRLDQGDSERTHADIRELMWTKAAGDWELRAGIGKVFWGVTESRHLVDIINQTDAVEDIDFEDKLGQPMVELSWIQQWGVVDLFLLPYFRERTFPGVDGRPRTQPRIDTDQARYESSAEQTHFDYALRWSHSIEQWDIGLSWFSGTSRDPRFTLGRGDNGEPVLIPNYDLIDQAGLDLQGTFDAWLWKLEVIRRVGQGEPFNALTGGFEYTFFDIFGSGADLGLLAEYLYDSRGRGGDSAFQDDLLAGVRLALNDEQSSELLIGQIVDRSTGAISINLEASRRLGDDWKLELEGRFFEQAKSDDPAYSFRKDDYLQLRLAWYF